MPAKDGRIGRVLTNERVDSGHAAELKLILGKQSLQALQEKRKVSTHVLTTTAADALRKVCVLSARSRESTGPFAASRKPTLGLRCHEGRGRTRGRTAPDLR